MLGLFDSGNGGLNTVRYIKADGYADLIYLIDRENAPYGIKTQKELVRIAEQNIKRLTDMGAERVLIACCTASTVYPMMRDEYRRVSIPIIEDVAKRAKNATRCGRIGVIATDRTVRSLAFPYALPTCYVKQVAAKELVTLIDAGLNDRNIDKDGRMYIESLIAPLIDTGIDTLILGCTHFPALIETFKEITFSHGIRCVIDSARAGADLITNMAKSHL